MAASGRGLKHTLGETFLSAPPLQDANRRNLEVRTFQAHFFRPLVGSMMAPCALSGSDGWQVVILSEKCGLIEWVPNTKGLRQGLGSDPFLERRNNLNISCCAAAAVHLGHVIDDLWKGRKNPRQSLNEVKELFDRSKDASTGGAKKGHDVCTKNRNAYGPQDIYETFTRQVLPRNPPILHRHGCLPHIGSKYQ